MGALTTYLQQEFARKCPPEWICHPERHLVPPAFEKILGYAARADVFLAKRDGSRNLWVEFEVSRADPVANHAKFATSNLFQPQASTDTFVSMISSHVARGRRNLAANTILLMRHLGMRAFQTVLFPSIAASGIKRLNHLNVELIGREGLPVEEEIERVIAVSEVVLQMKDFELHLVGELLEVILNAIRWNSDMATDEGRRLWGRRTVAYFVYDNESRLFAPSKYCAYAAVPVAAAATAAEPTIASLGTMTVEKYTSISDGTHLLDGARAQLHLTKALGMVKKTAADLPVIADEFSAWHSRLIDSVTIHPKGPIFLIPPCWFS